MSQLQTNTSDLQTILETVNALPTGKQSDWNQNDETQLDFVKNRPFYEQMVEGETVTEPLTLTWDGDATGKNTIDMGEGVIFVKVSDILATNEEIQAASGTVSTPSGDMSANVSDMMEDSMFLDDFVILGYMGTPVGAVIRVPNCDISGDGSVVVEETGFYFLLMPSYGMYTKEFSMPSCTYTKRNKIIHKLPNKFIDAEWMATSGQEQFEGEILSKCTESFGIIGGGQNKYSLATNIDLLKKGDNVEVIWDGTVYESVLKTAIFPAIFDNSSIEFLYAGNIGGMYQSLGLNIVEDTGEPFAIMFKRTDLSTMESTLDCTVSVATESAANMEHSFSIYAKAKVNKLPEKFLPYSVAMKSDIPENIVQTVNGIVPDENGNVQVEIPEIPENIIQTVNGTTPDKNGNVQVEIPELPENIVQTVNGIVPDENGNVQVEIPEIPENIVQTVNGVAPDENGNVQVEIPEVDLSSKPGEKVEGNTYTIDGKTVTALPGAEIFNNYDSNIATGFNSHAEGNQTIASGQASHAEGMWTVASKDGSHSEGMATLASGMASHAEGLHTRASSEYQHVQGKYNIEDTSNTYAHIVGNGSVDARSNAHTLDWQGNAWFQGDIYVGGTSQDDGKILVTKEYVDSLFASYIAEVAALIGGDA